MLKQKSKKQFGLKLTYWCPGIDYRVASLSTRYQTAKGLNPVRYKSK